MALSERSLSRLVSALKVVLPLSAVGVLSTLFLLSGNSDPVSTIPFTTIDLKDAARSERIMSPSFAGATEQGDLIAFVAESATPKGEQQAGAESLTATIDLVSGQQISFRADEGEIDRNADTALLTGGVTIRTSTGYLIETEALTSGLTQIRAESEGHISGEGPLGRFTAGRMNLTSGAAENSAYIVFSEGIDLIYDPDPAVAEGSENGTAPATSDDQGKERP
ncbi:hypothetical protein [Pseudooceanicola algae]|uniref:Lipopolysaccharide-assembly, LptC-related n=1 Tax=Pseudooceanicola algae TaxID=1537215 RepID=A0A418SB99_9RHOB|nr:hypothetical protein [Pseudooceanicola algae]QPM91396.1 hypothetical protein PSAL_026490 [Pseudooceanicola algae]